MGNVVDIRPEHRHQSREPNYRLTRIDSLLLMLKNEIALAISEGEINEDFGIETLFLPVSKALRTTKRIRW